MNSNFVKLGQGIKYAHRLGSFEVSQSQEFIVFGLDHVYHLTEGVNEWHSLESKTLHSLSLLFIEKFQLIERKPAVSVKVHASVFFRPRRMRKTLI